MRFLAAEELWVVGETDVDHAVWDWGLNVWTCAGGCGSGCWDGDKGRVVNTVTVYLPDIKVGLYGLDVGRGDVVGGAVDAGGGF